MFALVDANSFYCSAEQVFRPEWRGKPIIVLSNNDGCIVAANKQAISLGITKFQPYFKVQQLCKEKGIIVCSSNYELYGDLSNKMMQIIGRYAPQQHIYSIDESFLSFEHYMQSIPCLIEHAQKIRKAVWKETRLPVCVGLGPTLTLAKLANHIAKRLPEFKGVYLLESLSSLNKTDTQKQLLEKLSTGDVWGIGRKTVKKLQAHGIHNIAELMYIKPHQIKQHFNVELLRTIKELSGEQCKCWDQTRADKLQIFSSRSLGTRIVDIDSLKQALVKHASIAAAKARKQGLLCAAFIVFTANSPFDKQPRSFKIIKHFRPPTNSTADLIQAISEAMSALYMPGVQYYKIGVGLLDLTSEHDQQYELFNPHKTDAPLMKLLDNINHKYGSDTLHYASQGLDEKWSMRREFLTPQYTTSWGDIPKIHCE